MDNPEPMPTVIYEDRYNTVSIYPFYVSRSSNTLYVYDEQSDNPPYEVSESGSMDMSLTIAQVRHLHRRLSEILEKHENRL